jgi:hypothetical protein
MKAELIQMIIQLPFETARALVHRCEKEYLLPRQAIAHGLGIELQEPVIFKLPKQDKWTLRPCGNLAELQNREGIGRGIGEQKEIYLSILSQLVQAMPDEFSTFAPGRSGTRRKYFGRSRQEVEATGKSNEADQIPKTDSWASVNNSADRKHEILLPLLRDLRFSPDYAAMISWAPCYRFPILSDVRFKGP